MTWNKKGRNAKATADRYFSQYIRLRDTNNQGYGSCISCGQLKHYDDLDCGHFINRGNMNLRFNEVNCNAQCRKCNRFDEGNFVGYQEGLIKKWGQEKYALLVASKQEIRRYSKWELKAIADHYKARAKELRESKTF